MANELPNETSIIEIDILIGNDYYDDIIRADKVRLDNGLYLINSSVGMDVFRACSWSKGRRRIVTFS